MDAVPANVIYLSTILGRDGPFPVHKCDWKCQNEIVCGNMFRCKLTGITHICDKNCNQRILYDNNNSLCRLAARYFRFLKPKNRLSEASGGSLMLTIPHPSIAAVLSADAMRRFVLLLSRDLSQLLVESAAKLEMAWT